MIGCLAELAMANVCLYVCTCVRADLKIWQSLSYSYGPYLDFLLTKREESRFSKFLHPELLIVLQLSGCLLQQQQQRAADPANNFSLDAYLVL